MITIRARGSGANVPFVAVALGVLAGACDASNPGAAGHGALSDAALTGDASSTNGPEDASSNDSGRTVQLTWRVAEAAPLTTEGLDDGGMVADAAAVMSASAVGDGGAQGIEGVDVCVYENSAIPCVVTDADGVFTLPGLPATSNLALTFRKDGYGPVLLPIATPNTDMNGLSSAGGPITMPGTASPPVAPVALDFINKGSVSVVAIILGPSGTPTDFTGDVGAKVRLTPMTGSGPYFLDRGNNAIVPSATSMVDDVAVYFNLDPGDYEVTVDDPSHACAPISTLFGGYGYPAPPTSVKFPIVAGYVTSAVAVYCTAQSATVNTVDAN